MTGELPATDDSVWLAGGHIPGAPGSSAFVLSGPAPTRIPVLIAVPHAGRGYTPALLRRLRDPDLAALRLEDRFVDRLARGIAQATGAMLLVARAPRAMIDLNRAPDDVDWEMFGRVPPNLSGGRAGGAAAEGTASHGTGLGGRARSGLGLIPRRLPGMGELWRGRHEPADLDARIAGVHAPYHACLGEALGRLRARWGTALLIDLHSMPSLPAQRGEPAPEFVLGDRFGASCDGSLAAASFAFFAERGRKAAHNRPYAGGYVLERHGKPRAGIHALQLEIDRASYLDRQCTKPGEGFALMAATLSALVSRLGSATAGLARAQQGSASAASGWADAAE
ncbi:MAG: N-formylglutamate amidohydrolase [Novosphingobium sp.]